MTSTDPEVLTVTDHSRHSGSRRLEVLKREAPHLVAVPEPVARLVPFAGIVAEAERRVAAESPAARSAAAAASIADALVSLPPDPREALLELHGALVTLPGYAEGDDPTLDAILTELERRYMSRGPVAS